MPRRLRFSLELVENSLSLDAESPSRSRLARSDRRDILLDEPIVSHILTARLLPRALLIGQLF